MNIQVELETPESLWVYPATFLGDRFGLYTKLVLEAGGKYVEGRGRSRLPIANFDKLNELLEAEDFTCRFAIPTLVAIRSYNAERVARLAETTERGEVVAEKLRDQGLELYAFQKEGAAKLAAEQSYLLGDHPGLGKTLQALLAATRESPLLVVCPAVAKAVWEREARKWRPELKVTVLEGRMKSAKQDGVVIAHSTFRWPEVGEMLVINYDILPNLRDDVKIAQGELKELKKRHDEFKTALSERDKKEPPLTPEERKSFTDVLERFEVEIAKVGGRIAKLQECCLSDKAPPKITLIADEAHVLKGQSIRSKRFTALARLIRASGGQTWGLTGTPILNDPPELWKLLSVFDLHIRAFGTYPTYKTLFNATKGPYAGTVWGSPHPSVPARLARVMLRRERKDVLPQLPVKTWSYLRVPLDKVTQKLCDAAFKELQDVGINLDDAKDLTRVTAKRGAGFEQLSAARKALAAVKLPTALEFIEHMEAQEEPLLVFASHRAPIDVIAKREGWAAVTGSTPDDERKRLNDLFQAGGLKGLAMTVQAGGVALTLTRASQVLFLDRMWTPALNEQAEDRVLRHGQTRGVVITILEVDHAIDRRVNELLLQKQDLIDSTLGSR